MYWCYTVIVQCTKTSQLPRPCLPCSRGLSAMCLVSAASQRETLQRCVSPQLSWKVASFITRQSGARNFMKWFEHQCMKWAFCIISGVRLVRYERRHFNTSFRTANAWHSICNIFPHNQAEASANELSPREDGQNCRASWQVNTTISYFAFCSCSINAAGIVVTLYLPLPRIIDNKDNHHDDVLLTLPVCIFRRP